MQAILSRINDVFEIAGRGCVIWPGIPSSTAIRVQVGDAVVIQRPDGSTHNTQVRGIEMTTGSPGKTFIPILLDDSLTKNDLPIGSEIHIDATTESELSFTIKEHSFSQFASSFFTVDEEQHVRFGWSAVTIHAAAPENLLAIAHEVRDFVMEGFVSYLVLVQPHSQSLTFRVGLLGLNRDKYVPKQLARYFNQAGITAERDK